MRLLFRDFVLLLILTAAASGADPFLGRWKLNVEKSVLGDTNNVKTGTTTYELRGDGYLYDATLVFDNSKVARLHSAIQFDGDENEARLDGRVVKFVSQRINSNSYQVVVTDKQT